MSDKKITHSTIRFGLILNWLLLLFSASFFFLSFSRLTNIIYNDSAHIFFYLAFLSIFLLSGVIGGLIFTKLGLDKIIIPILCSLFMLCVFLADLSLVCAYLKIALFFYFVTSFMAQEFSDQATFLTKTDHLLVIAIILGLFVPSVLIEPDIFLNLKYFYLLPLILITAGYFIDFSFHSKEIMKSYKNRKDNVDLRKSFKNISLVKRMILSALRGFILYLLILVMLIITLIFYYVLYGVFLKTFLFYGILVSIVLNIKGIDLIFSKFQKKFHFFSFLLLLGFSNFLIGIVFYLSIDYLQIGYMFGIYISLLLTLVFFFIVSGRDHKK
ncbi:MAG: hypothetical protein ACOC44_06350 [Promethearchaeia archaeon]